MKAVNNKTGIPIVQKPVQMVDIKDIRAFHERDDAGIDAKIADVRNGSYAPVILRNGGSGLYSLIEREAEFDAFEALHKNEEASKYTHIKAIVVNSEAEARDVFKSLKLGSYAPPSSRYVVADVLRNVRNDVEEAAASDDDDPIIYNGEIEYYISQGYKETLESLDTAEFESLLFGQCKLLETILGQFKSGLCESGNQDWPYKIKISNIAIRKSEIHDFNQLLGFFESNVIGLKGRFTKKGGKMKVENKKTGKIAHVVSASETHYNVKLDDGRRSRWVKTNCRIFDGYIDVDESGNVYDPQEKVAPAEDTIDVDPKETALEKKETSPPEVDAELIRDTVAMIDRILADGYLPLDRIISGYAEHWLENGIIRIGKVEGHEVYILNKREDVEVVRGLLEHFFKEELHPEKGVVASIIPETSPLDDYIDVMDDYHRIAEQRDVEKESPALIVEKMVEPLIESIHSDLDTVTQRIVDQLDYANCHLQNIALDIEKISQAIPFPDELGFPFQDEMTTDFRTDFQELQRSIHENAVSKGWWEDDSVPDKLLMIHTEISEAVEDFRVSKMAGTTLDASGKPTGFPIELADIVIRVLDLAGHLKINLFNEILRKHEYNKKRPYRHGGKVI